MSSRFVQIVGLIVVLSITSVACYVQPGTGDESGTGSKAGAFGGKSGTNSDSTDGASCDSVCKNILTCKGVDNAQNRAKCISNCTNMNISASDRQTISEADCATIDELLGSQPQPSSSGGTTGGSKAGLDCDGCVRDGNECVWGSQSNWGAGAYSGAVTSCDARCCQ